MQGLTPPRRGRVVRRRAGGVRGARPAAGRLRPRGGMCAGWSTWGWPSTASSLAWIERGGGEARRAGQGRRPGRAGCGACRGWGRARRRRWPRPARARSGSASARRWGVRRAGASAVPVRRPATGAAGSPGAGPAVLRKLLVECAWAMLRYNRWAAGCTPRLSRGRARRSRRSWRWRGGCWCGAGRCCVTAPTGARRWHRPPPAEAAGVEAETTGASRRWEVSRVSPELCRSGGDTSVSQEDVLNEGAARRTGYWGVPQGPEPSGRNPNSRVRPSGVGWAEGVSGKGVP